MTRKILLLTGIALATPSLAQVRLPSRPQPTPQAPRLPTTGPVKPIALPTPKPTTPTIVQQQKSTPSIVAGAPAAKLFMPGLVVTSAPKRPGMTGVVQIEVTGLGDSRAVHLLGFQSGCGFARTSRLVGSGNDLHATGGTRAPQGFSSDETAAFTPASSGRSFSITRYNAAGIPVQTGGVVKFSLAGRLAVEGNSASPRFDGQAVAQASSSGEISGAGYAPFLHLTRQITGSATTCVASGMIMVLGNDGTWRMADSDGVWKPVATVTRPKIYQAAPFFLDSHRRVTIENTSTLRTLLKPAVIQQDNGRLSSCSGTSIGPASFPIGALTRNDDIAFVIRSGPLATACRFSTQPGILPEGVRIVSATFSISRVGDKCRYYSGGLQLMPGYTAQMLVNFGLSAQYSFYTAAQSGAYYLLTGEQADLRETNYLGSVQALLKQTLPARAIDNDRAQTYQGLSVHGFENPYILPHSGLLGTGFNREVRAASPSRQGYDIFEPMGGLLFCQETLVNDHEIALKLDRVVADVPIGVSFP